MVATGPTARRTRRPWLRMFLGGLVKLAALALLTRHLVHKSARDGLVLGASVGFGIAAFESAGYALTAMITAHGLSLMDLVSIELLRGLLAPFARPVDGDPGRRAVSRSTGEHFLLTGRPAPCRRATSLSPCLHRGADFAGTTRP